MVCDISNHLVLKANAQIVTHLCDVGIICWAASGILAYKMLHSQEYNIRVTMDGTGLEYGIKCV
jgi:hypothetical protein